MLSLTGKYVKSPIDNKEYCRKNGQFKKHIVKNGYNTYQEFFETYYPELIQYCECGEKCSFVNSTMSYKKTCGSPDCRGKEISNTKSKWTDEDWDKQLQEYRKTMSLKTPEEIQALYQGRWETAIANDSYNKAVIKREQTCMERYGDAKYNNSSQISETKQNWSEERKQLFLKRLKEAFDGGWMSDYATDDTWVKRRKNLEEKGMVTPLDQLSEWELYRNKTRRLTERTYKENKKTINPDDLPRKLGEYELDHIIPVFYGFQNNIPPEVIASVENLQMLTMRENRSKRFNYDE